MLKRTNRYPLFLAFTLILSAAPLVSADDAAPSGDDAAILRSYHSGNGLLQRQMFNLAADEYRRFLDEHADHPKATSARYGLAVCEFRQGRTAEALAELTRLEGIEDFAYAAEVQTMLGQCHLSLAHYADASRCFERVVSRHASHKLAADAAALLAESRFREGKPDDAIHAARTVLKNWPDSPARERAIYFSGLAATSLGHHGEAAAAFEKILSDFPSGSLASSARLLAAQSLQRDGKTAEAERRFEEIVSLGKSDQQADALLGLGLLLFQKGDLENSARRLGEFSTGFPTNPRLPTARLYLARILLERGEAQKAADLFKQASDSDEKLADEAAYWLAKCDLRNEDFAAAAKRLGEALKKFPESRLRPEFLYDRGVALYRAGDFAGAEDSLSKFQADYGDHSLVPDALHLSALALHQSGAYKKSAAACEKFAKNFPKHPLASDVALLAAENLFLAGDFEKAAGRYRRFLKDFPKSPDAPKAAFRLGLADYRLGKLDQAAPYLENALNDSDDKAFQLAMPALADIYFHRSDWRNAEEWFGKYVAAHPDAPGIDDAMLKYALSLERQQNFKAAAKSFDRLRTSSPDSPHALQALFERAQCLAALNQSDEAEKLFAQVFDQDPKSRFAPHALQHLGRIAQARGDHKKAAEFFARAGHGLPKEVAEDALYAEAQSLLAAKNYPDAEKLLRKVIKKTKDEERRNSAAAALVIAVSRQDRTPEALKLFSNVNLKDLDAATRDALRYERAWCLKQLGKREEAMTAYRELIDAVQKPNPSAVLELAVMEDETDRHEEAAKHYAQACELAAKEEDASANSVAEQATYRLGVSEFERGEFAKAARRLDDFTKTYPKSPFAVSAHAICGEALFKLNRHGPAAEHFQIVIDGDAKDPTWSGALLRMGECQAGLQRWARSEEAFARYLKEFPKSDNWYQAAFGLAWAIENQGRLDDAIGRYQIVVDNHNGPTAARAQFQIGECLFAGKKYEDAARELVKVDILYAYPEWSAAALYEAGRCFQKLSKDVEARRQFKQVVDKYADSKWAALAVKHLQEAVAGMPGH